MGEILSFNRRTDRINPTLTGMVKRVISDGNAIHCSTENQRRIVRVLATPYFSKEAPLLGYGEDGTAEAALWRAVLSNAERIRESQRQVTPTDYPVSTLNQKPLQPPSESVFDAMVSGPGHVKVFGDGQRVIAVSNSSQGGGLAMPAQAIARDSITALTRLGEQWRVEGDYSSWLPPVLFQK